MQGGTGSGLSLLLGGEEYQEFAGGQNLTAASGFGCVLFNLAHRGFSVLLGIQPRCCWMPLPNASAVSFIMGFWFCSLPSACLPVLSYQSAFLTALE